MGAGSGAVDLITLRGKKVLEEADVIIYAGSLVNEELLNFAKESCVIFNSALMTLEQVIDVVIKNREKRIVRLHTGDPCLYGAVREQMDELDRLGIEYSVVPGVSSFCGAASALNAEYTLPGISQSVVITRLEGRTSVPERESVRAFAEHQCSMAIFLSTGMLEKLSEELIGGGYSADTPAAIVYKATWPEEKTVRCTVGTLFSSAQKNGITKTALILVGRFLDCKYEKSKLYDASFSTEFRKASE